MHSRHVADSAVLKVGDMARKSTQAHKKTTSPESAFKNWIQADLFEKYLDLLEPSQKAAQKTLQQTALRLKKNFSKSELKTRVALISEALYITVLGSYAAQIKALVEALALSSEPRLTGFELWPLLHFIQTYGLQDYKISIKAIEQLTPFFTGEFAIQPFFANAPKQTILEATRWSLSKNHHVRRLASEGSRSRLPWGMRQPLFIENPKLTLPILENLKHDPELYVRKSVANHLNDLSKDHSDYVITLLKKWTQQSPKKHQEKIAWITKQALRTLIKKGHPEALSLIGFNSKAQIELIEWTLHQRHLRIGEKLQFSMAIKTPLRTQVLIDYAIHYRKANGTYSPKVFKGTQRTCEAGVLMTIEKSHSFKTVTTRTLYPGVHYVELLINGKSYGKQSFTLKSPAR